MSSRANPCQSSEILPNSLLASSFESAHSAHHLDPTSAGFDCTTRPPCLFLLLLLRVARLIPGKHMHLIQSMGVCFAHWFDMEAEFAKHVQLHMGYVYPHSGDTPPYWGISPHNGDTPPQRGGVSPLWRYTHTTEVYLVKYPRVVGECVHKRRLT